MKTHKFTLTVKTVQSKAAARRIVLSVFALRRPDYCQFYLRSSPTNRKKGSF